MFARVGVSSPFDFAQILTAMASSSGHVEGSAEASLLDDETQLELAIAASLSESDNGAVRRHSASHHQFPTWINVTAITPNGWCFYDCVCVHIAGDESIQAEVGCLSKQDVFAIVISAYEYCVD